MNYLSDILIADYFNQVKYHLPLSKRSSDASIQAWLNNALSRYSKFYIDNNKGLYTAVGSWDFYNANSPLINIRGFNSTKETRWCQVTPDGLYSKRITSCMLQSIVPNELVLPTGISYVQDITIGVTTDSSVNSQMPAINKGLVALVGGRSTIGVLSLDSTGNLAFKDIIQITAVWTYYRNVHYPNWTGGVEGETIDIAKSDVELVANYVVDEAYLPFKAPVSVDNMIQEREFEILYGS